MRVKCNFLMLCCFMLIIACKSYMPFSSKKERTTSVKLIKSKFKLTDKEYNTIKNEDSILFSVSKSLDKKINLNLIERRLDSFFVDNYTKKQLLIILKLDFTFPNQKYPFELNKSIDADGFDIKNIDALKKFMNGGGFEKKLDSVMSMKHKDSTKKKKH